MRFHQYQALGNDYVILERADADADISSPLVRRLCDRHFGIGSDGILLEDTPPDGRFALRIFNPDGSEAEKSGNGLRIFARYLYDQGRIGDEVLTIHTLGGEVRCRVRDGGRAVFVESAAHVRSASNNGMQRAALRAAADAGRWAAPRTL